MGWIILLIIIGLVLFFAELVILPGITLAALGAFACLTAAATWSFMEFGAITGFIVIGIILLLVALETVLFLSPKMWKKAALNTKISETIAAPIQTLVPLNTIATALTRLAPMGKIIINDVVYEAKSLDNFIDQQTEVIVINYDNHVLIVKPFKNN